MGMIHLLPAPVLFGGLALFMAVTGAWTSGVALLFPLSLSLGWRRSPQRAALWGALAYVALGVVAAMAHRRGLPSLAASVGPAFGAVFLAFIGHALGAAFRGARDAAVDGGKAAAAQIGASLSGVTFRPPSAAPAATASLPARPAPRSRREPVALPKGWTPTVSPRRRGLFG